MSPFFNFVCWLFQLSVKIFNDGFWEPSIKSVNLSHWLFEKSPSALYENIFNFRRKSITFTMQIYIYFYCDQLVPFLKSSLWLGILNLFQGFISHVGVWVARKTIASLTPRREAGHLCDNYRHCNLCLTHLVH